MAASFLFAIAIAMIFGFGRNNSSEDKEWQVEKAILPIRSGGVKFEVKAKVRWNPETNEIHRENVGDTGFGDKDWIEITRHTKLYNKLLRNFQRKYSPQQQQRSGRQPWTVAE